MFGEETAREIDCAVRGIVGSAFDRTVKLLSGRRDVLEAGAKQLLKKETLNDLDLQALRNTPSAQAATDIVAPRGAAHAGIAPGAPPRRNGE